MPKMINVIDLFAGPGGLGEGFASSKHFKIRMSVEKETSAHQTLTLRALYRTLETAKAKAVYQEYAAHHISKKDLIASLPAEWDYANEETLGAPLTLGLDNAAIHQQLRHLKKIHANESWVVIGGPPCQAYSLVGRARNKGVKNYSAENDQRHYLYQEYLEVLSIIQPDVFVMENVKGILSSTVAGEQIFPKIRSDLENPTTAVLGKPYRASKTYRIYSLNMPPETERHGQPKYRSDKDFVVKAEQFGIPQARHRVILLGVSTDIAEAPTLLELKPAVNIEHVLGDLPRLRSRLSRGADSPEAWAEAIREQTKKVVRSTPRADSRLRKVMAHMTNCAERISSTESTYANTYLPKRISSRSRQHDLVTWLTKSPQSALLNHEARGHMPEDLARYLFCSCWAEIHAEQELDIPKAKDFPRVLHPRHKNWTSGKFADRFRVQPRGRPATTITSHISKDGHYFIHFDPTQCRSLTVREAARLQTFPDNYLFEGNRTEQYVQVGNAVPPFLARQIAEIVYRLL